MLNPSIPSGRGLPLPRRRERGITIAMLAVFIVVLFIISALAIDIGVLYTARTSAQHAADAAALAGAFTFVNSPNAADPALLAKNAAINIAGQNSILGQSVTIAPADVSVDTGNRRVTVTVSRLAGSGITTFFARIIGISSVDVQTRATAEAGSNASGGYCIKPIYIPNTALSSLTVPNACSGNQLIFDSSGNLTTFALSQIGNTFLVRPMHAATSVVPAQFGSASLGSSYQCAIESCLNECGLSASQMACGASISVEANSSELANQTDPETQLGFQDLITNTPDQWQGVGEYISGGVVQDTSKSLVPVIVWDNCPPHAILPDTSGQTITPLGFATVFITRVSSDVEARFVYAASCTGSHGGTGPQAVPVRLVQTP